MNSQEFTNLYAKQDSDETITSFQNEAGFSLVRLYPKNTPYYKNGRRIFIKIAILDRGLFYGVDMTKPEKRGEAINYVITDGEEYKKKITNFVSNTGDGEFVFDESQKKVKHSKTGIYLTINEFVEVLVANHLSDRLFWKRRGGVLANMVLKTLFWLSDKRYEKVKVSIDKYHFSRDKKPILEDQKNIEPFFRYFYISKNLIFSILLTTFLVTILVAFFPYKIPINQIWDSLFGKFSLSNPLVFLILFLVLFSSEKLSIRLDKSIKDFLMPEENHFHEHKETFIGKLHNYQYLNKFDLKL